MTDLQEFLKRMEQAGQPPLPTPPPLVESVATATAAPAAPQVDDKEGPAAAVTPTAAVTVEPELYSARGAQWSAALRDRTGLRHAVMAAEIIGPPKALQ